MSGTDRQARILALMRESAPPGASVEVIETHAARVFLSGERAFKLKKPVDLGFLDFSTREERAAALEAELRLNQAAAPQIYRRLIWITQTGDGALTLDGEGARVEPVLEMTRFDQACLLDEIARKGRLDGALARDIADAVFDSHERAVPVHDGPGGAARIRGVLAGAVQRCRDERGADAARIDRLGQRLDERLCEHAELLDARARAGYVRRCHGDLHLQNMVWLDARPVLFDALEFDEALATTDTLYDLAFVLMDLCHRALHGAASALLSQYVARLDDDRGVAGVALAPAFCGVRALVRAMTRFERDGSGDREAGLAYLALAEQCAQPVTARLIGVGGLSGTGKSTLAEGLAAFVQSPPGALVIRADLERKAEAGLSWREELAKSTYTRAASRRVYERQRSKVRAALAAGASVIADAVHSKPDERAALEQAADAAGARFCGLWLEAGARTIQRRVAARRDDPSDADLEVAARQSEYDAGEISWTRFDADAGADAVLAAARTAGGLA